MHTLLLVLFLLLAIGFVMWVINKAPFIDASVKPFISWAALAICGFVLLWLLYGLVSGHGVALPK